MKITDEQLQEIINSVQGTCSSLGYVCEGLGFNEDDLTLDQLSEIDDCYIQCPNCGWWVEPHELANEDMCEDCYEAEEGGI